MLGVSATPFYYDITLVVSSLPIYLHLSTPLQYWWQHVLEKLCKIHYYLYILVLDRL